MKTCVGRTLKCLGELVEGVHKMYLLLW